MAKTIDKRMTVELPADEAMELLLDPAFQEAKEKAQGALAVTFEELHRDESRLRAELRVTQHARGKTGIDKSRTEVAVTSYEWDLAKRSCEWVYRDPNSDRVTVKGTVRVEALGERSALVDHMYLEVKVPLIGGQIEKVIVKEIETGWPRYEQVVRDFVARRKS